MGEIFDDWKLCDRPTHIKEGWVKDAAEGVPASCQKWANFSVLGLIPLALQRLESSLSATAFCHVDFILKTKPRGAASVTAKAKRSFILPPYTTTIIHIKPDETAKKPPVGTVAVECSVLGKFYLYPSMAGETSVWDAKDAKKDLPLVSAFWFVRRTKQERSSNCVLEVATVKLGHQAVLPIAVSEDETKKQKALEKRTVDSVDIPVLVNSQDIAAGEELVLYDPSA